MFADVLLPVYLFLYNEKGLMDQKIHMKEKWKIID